MRAVHSGNRTGCALFISACGGTCLSPSFCHFPLDLTARFPGILQIPAKSAHLLQIRRAGRTLRLRSKRRGGGFAAARAVPISSEQRCAPPRREKSCAEGQRNLHYLSAAASRKVGEGRAERKPHGGLPPFGASKKQHRTVSAQSVIRQGAWKCAVLLFILWKDKLRRCQRLSAAAKRACQYGVEISALFTDSPGEGLYIISLSPT